MAIKFVPILCLILIFILKMELSHNLDPYKSSIDDISRLETQRAKDWLEFYTRAAEEAYFKGASANWNYSTNITQYNLNIVNEADGVLSLFQQESAYNASLFNLSLIHDTNITRQLKKISKVGIKLNETESVISSMLTGNMTGIYSTATICSIHSNYTIDCANRWALSPHLTDIMSSSTDYEILKYIWESWREVAGKPIRSTYIEFIDLSNRGAKEDSFDNVGAWWRSWYEDDSFQEEIEKLWYQVLPLYEQLYAYVRKTLKNGVYGSDGIGNILPAHILGNMWAQDWSNIFQITAPYPNQTTIDVTERMLALNYTPLRMFQMGDEFFQSLGLKPLSEAFYAHSMLEKPKNRQVVCHPAAWDFYNGRDFRISTCTNVKMEEFVVIHHEIGHIQYYMHYSDLPFPFREGANPGFHEAIGDTILLSVSTPRHLHVIGLLENNEANEEQEINYLYKTALGRVAFLPFGYLIDLWRWKVFDGKYRMENWNEAWWKLRYKYQGLKPPSPRSQFDFDPGAKFHVPANVPYLRYFVASILQFQFYQAMCEAANHTGPLHQCDFYQNKKAGEVLANILKMGCSRPWRDVIETATGERNMSAQPLLAYFDPLMKWLKVQNDGECFGWGYKWPENVMRTLSTPRCTAD